MITLLTVTFAAVRERSIQSKFRSFALAVLPQNNNQYFVCTDLVSPRCKAIDIQLMICW